MRTLAASFSVVVFASALTLACSSSNNSGSAASSGPAKACTDTADAVAKAAVRCGLMYQPNYDAFVSAVGGCDNIVSVRDEASLRGTCFASLTTVSCADLNAGNIDASCKGQLLKAKAFQPTVQPLGDLASFMSIEEARSTQQ